MKSNEIAMKIIENTPMGRRKVEKPKYRWMDCVLEDIKRLKILICRWLLGKSC